MRTLAKSFLESTGAFVSEPPPSEGRSDLTHGAPGAARGAAFEGEGAPNLSRRSMVAAVAAALIPVAPALAAGGKGTGPDAELIELGRRYLDLVALETAAEEAYDRCCEACICPEKPEALRHRLEDHAGGLHLPFLEAQLPHGLSSDPSLNPFYVGGEVMRLRYAPPPFDPAEIPVQRARIAEIEREHEAWLERCRAADQAAGVEAAQEATDEIVTAMRSLAQQIASLRATTLVGMRVRALVISDLMLDENSDESDGTTDELIVSAMIRDLLSIKTT